MRNYKPAKLITVFTIFLTLIFVFTTVVAAHHVRVPRVLHEEDTTSSASKKEEKQALKQEKLNAVKLKVCEKVEARLKKRSVNIATKADKMADRFSRIAERVKEYYTNKLLPKGVTIDNYDALVADIAAHEAVANNAVANVKSSSSSFDCDANDPKGRLAQFKDEVKGVIAALKDYRETVVNLIVAVRTKAKNIKSPGATESAQPATGSAEPE